MQRCSHNTRYSAVLTIRGTAPSSQCEVQCRSHNIRGTARVNHNERGTTPFSQYEVQRRSHNKRYNAVLTNELQRRSHNTSYNAVLTIRGIVSAVLTIRRYNAVLTIREQRRSHNTRTRVHCEPLLVQIRVLTIRTAPFSQYEVQRRFHNTRYSAVLSMRDTTPLPHKRGTAPYLTMRATSVFTIRGTGVLTIASIVERRCISFVRTALYLALRGHGRTSQYVRTPLSQS